MRIREDAITPHNSSLSEASTKRDRERERKLEREREGKKPNRQRERDRVRDIGKSSMMGFDSATSSFLALIANQIKN